MADVTVDCQIHIGVSTAFMLYPAPLGTVYVLDCTPGVEIGVQIWTEIPAIHLPLEAGVKISTDFRLVAGKSIAADIPLQIDLLQGVSLSLTTAAIKPVAADVSVALVMGVSLGLKSTGVIPGVVDCTIGMKAGSNFGLNSPALTVLTTYTLMATPIAKVVGVSLGLTAGTPGPVMLDGTIGLKVGASLGLVSNVILEAIVQCNGGTCIGVSCFSAADSPPIFETWVVTGNNFAPSVYSGFPFNSYASFKNKEYAAGPDGIYLLEGEDDDGQEIHPGVRVVTNFGNEKHKRLRSMHLGDSGDRVLLRVGTANGDEGVFEPDYDDHRAKISRNLQSQKFVLDIIDFSELSQLEIVVLPLVKR